MLYYAIPSFALGIYFLQQQASLAHTKIYLGVGIASLMLLLITLILPKFQLAQATKYSYLYTHKYWQLGLVSLFMCACGCGWATWRAELRLQNRLCAADEMQSYTIQGKVANLPHLISGFSSQPGWRFILTTTSTEVEGTNCRLPSSLLLNWYNPPDISTKSNVQVGEHWQFTVTLKRPHGFANPGGNDYESWLLQHDIGATGRVLEGKRLAPLSSFSLSDFINQQRARLLTLIQTALPTDARHLGILQALAVGEQHAIHEEDWAIFRATGTSHLLAISGLHITLVAGMITWCGSWCWRRRKKLPLYLPAQYFGLVLGICAALIYSLLAGFQIPARRAFIMLSVAAIAHLSGRLPSAFLVLCWALFFVLLFDPWAVLSAGFWLSFVAVATILWAVNRPSHPLKEALPSSYLPSPPTFKQQLTRIREKAVQNLRQASKVQLAVSLALIPFTALFFGQIAVLSPVANAFAIPVFSFLVTPLTLLSLIAPTWLTSWLLNCAHQIVAWTTHLLSAISTWPLANLHVTSAIAAASFLALLGLIIFLQTKKAWRWLSLLLFGASIFLAFFLSHRSRPETGEFYALVFDVGQGGATLIRTAHHTLLYDTGPALRKNSPISTAKQTILPYLQKYGLTDLSTLIISHQDLDHSGGLLTLLPHTRIEKVFSSMDQDHALLQRLHSDSIPHYRCEAGQSWEWDGVRFSVIHPLANTTDKPNALSCTLRVANKHHTLLLPGDIGRKQEQEIILRTAPDTLTADVLVIPHHGSKTSSSPLWINTLQPQLAIAQVGYLNRFHHPHPEVLNRYQAQDITVKRSDYDGAIEIKTQGERLHWQSWREQHRRYWHWQEKNKERNN